MTLREIRKSPGSESALRTTIDRMDSNTKDMHSKLSGLTAATSTDGTADGIATAVDGLTFSDPPTQAECEALQAQVKALADEVEKIGDDVRTLIEELQE